ncbi:non-homologous end-joining DNA ligase [Marixanthomonas spongiae]|uniref:DNA ligase (ATP) n=1 Tax=Marixanthomonas spongiae TaxID=2174845 RepID=A0A2U0I565_9FLAO|nr:non-homologous end-joining DNA ligase [Marixanthomonas spongiae]PVW16239.1 ATP-dependent DNA ligase [Marixanthomonas spongiae]
MHTLKELLTKTEFEKATKAPLPDFAAPMLATLTDDYFDDPQWIYERKLDGMRCLIRIDKGKAQLFSRNENDLSASFPEIADALNAHKYPSLWLDGEIVAFKDNKTSFSKLQNRIHLTEEDKITATNTKVYLYLFDILHHNDYDVTEIPLKTRKKLLKQSLDWQDPIRYTPHRNEDGTDFLEEACQKGWEGIIAKDATASYVHGRSKKWLKFKCSKGQELVLGGFTEPQGERKGFGALLVGYYKEGKLQYAGKVGTGFDDAFLKTWRKKFDSIEQEESPFSNFNDTENGNNHWIKPKYVGEFAFTEWTKHNKLRHPRFLGMRNDKESNEVTKEKPQ